MHYHFANTRVADTGVADTRIIDTHVLTNHISQKGFLKNRLFKMMSISTLSAILCLNLCACSTTSETFDCKAGKGVGCKSISEVNQMVDSDTRIQGGFGESKVEKGKQPVLPLETASLSTPSMATDSLTVEKDKTLLQQTEIPLSDTIAVHRVQEEHLRVWIAPFQDEQGNLHEGSVIYTILKPGYWQLRASPQRVMDSRVADSRVTDSRINNPSVNEPRVDDSIVSDPTSFGLEEAD